MLKPKLTPVPENIVDECIASYQVNKSLLKLHVTTKRLCCVIIVVYRPNPKAKWG